MNARAIRTGTPLDARAYRAGGGLEPDESWLSETKYQVIGTQQSGDVTNQLGPRVAFVVVPPSAPTSSAIPAATSLSRQGAAPNGGSLDSATFQAALREPYQRGGSDL